MDDVGMSLRQATFGDYRANAPSSSPATSCVVLVTGFGAFPGTPRNPTTDIVAALERRTPRFARLGVSLHCVLLPVCFGASQARVQALIRHHRPDVILHLGVAGRRKHVSIETRALNRAGPMRPDAAGHYPAQVLDLDAPLTRRAGYRAEHIVATLRRRGIDARLSIDAGDYVCNATLYRSLENRRAIVGFMHVPNVRRFPHRPGQLKSPTVASLTDAALIALFVIITSKKRRP